ncbi:asparagine synthase-related protein [Sphingomonas sp. BT-65]|uniref:asparagine synthase-related protein n=1 Tax=Sphingomonas sp. BT-65 TaxID=2989821 RepID=UPI002235F1EF|nr:asparagine synthase-related protein [Sphingomonas sp. BT-65]MCW4460837.1 asparagine synthase-related protein [Sphingomonas sp. BT-65]
MRPRYLLLISGGDNLAGWAQRVESATGLRLAWSEERLALLVNGSCGCLEIPGFGAVVGALFHRHGPARAVSALRASDHGAFAQRGMDHLLGAWWGGYVAVQRRGDTVEIMRDPSGALPCYRGESADGLLLASDLDLLLAGGAIVPGIDWNALARLLWSGGLPTRETALAGVTALLPGAAVALTGAGERVAMRWSPWDHAEPDGLPEEERAVRLRRVVQQCVAGWASLSQRPLVSLSGGLDSSIVAACLAEAGSDVRCATMYTADPAGDERSYARALCAHLGLPLAECPYDLDAVDIARAQGLHLPRPAGRAQNQAYERAHMAVAERESADVFFTGNGGDNVFGYSQSAAALADRVLHEGLGVGAFRTFRDICAQTGAGPMRVLGAALRVARRPAAYRWKPKLALLHPDLVEAAGRSDLSHPWLDAPERALPGKAAHIAGLVRVQLTIEPDRSLRAPVVNPLLAQPVMEACLAIPSWEWRAGGRDRAAARTAFAGLLPSAIVERRSKGTPDPFLGVIVRHNRGALRERLLDGALAGRGLLDRAALEQALAPDRQTTGEEHMRLLELANIEAWVRAWTSRPVGQGRPVQPGPCAARPSA